MKNHVKIVAVLFFFFLLAINKAYTVPPNTESNPQDQYVEGELLVKFKPGTPGLAKSEAHRGVGASLIKDFQSLRLQHVDLPKGLSVQAAIESYEKNPNIEYAEPNYIVSADAFPTDPSFNQLWGLHSEGLMGATFDADIDAPEAWDITTGMTNTVVAVIDTGIDYNHEDLAQNMWTNQAELYGTVGVDDDGNGYIDDIYGIDTINGDSDPMDDHSHGTHVAGTIGAIGNNSIGVTGVNWGVSIIACKFLGWDGYGDTAGAIECVDYINTLKLSGVNIIASNNSWGGGGYSLSLRNAIDSQRDILFIAAAGNYYTDNDEMPHYPSSYDLPNVIAVTATDNDDVQRYNYGRRTVHVAAPGYGSIYSTIPGNSYGSKSGTSMATPHVTGVAALLSSEYPALSWKEIKNLILSGGDDKPTLTDTTITGKRLNALGSLTCTDSSVFSVLKSPDSLTIGMPVTMSALSINCENPAGPVTVTVTGGTVIDLFDNGTYPDAEAGDGIFTAEWTSTVDSGRVTFSSPGGSETFAPNFNISTPFLVEGNVNYFYSQTLETVDGVAPITWSIKSGALPPGLSLNSASGEISGQPVVEGTYTFTVEAVGADGFKAEKDFTLKVVNSIIIAEWAKYFDGVMDEAFNDVARDSAGNIYAAGFASSSVGMTYDFLIIKYDESGNIMWSRTYDDGGDENAYGIAIDNSGNVVVTGEKVTYPAEPPFFEPYFDRVTVKYDSSGTLLWGRTLDIGSNASAHDVAVDTTGNVYITGFGFANATSLDEDILTAIYDPDGNLIDEWSLDRGSFERGHGIAVDSGGNVIVSGESGFGEFFTVKYDPSGAIMWERPEVNEASAWARDVAVDDLGNIYAVGDISNTVVSNSSDVLVYKYDPSGNTVWNKAYYDSRFDEGMAVDVDQSGNVYIAGSEMSPESQFLVLKYGTDGTLLWERRYQSAPSGVNEAHGIAADASGNAYVAGYIYDGLTLNALLVKLSPQFGITTSSLPDATVGQSYDQTLTAAGGQTPYSWGIVNGTLPQGLSLDGVAGTISGTPASSETSNFTVQVTDANSDTATKNLSITVIPSLVITTSSLPDGEVGTPYGENLMAAGGVSPYSWAIINGGLPNGLFYGQTGYISGTPTTPGTFNFTAQVTDANSDTATKDLSITITDALVITTSSLTDGEIGTPYNETLMATGGQTPYSWGIVNGTWPNGLILNSTTGDIYGTPTATGTSNFTAQVTDVNSDIATKNLSITINGGLAITTLSLPDGEVGTPYSGWLTATGGQTPYIWDIINGTLPPGLNLGSTTGHIHSAPTAAGTYNFTARVTDANSDIATRDLSITIADAFVITTVSLPNGETGTPYGMTLTAAGGQTPYSWGIINGTLPQGLIINSITGDISGTPTTAGTSNFTARVTDANSDIATRDLSITITDALVITTASLPDGDIDTPYAQTLTATGGQAPYSWGLVNGTLPQGLTINMVTGEISGTPTTTGTSNFTARVTDANSSIATKDLSISVYDQLIITTASFPNGKLGTPYNQTLTATGGQTPYSWSIISGSLPPGLSLDAATGTISGTPTTTGMSNFTVKVTDAVLNTTTKDLTIFVQDLDIVTASLPPADIGVSYQQTLEATGGTLPYTWSVLSGILPFGLTLDSASGMISGIPSTSGTYSFTVQVQDAGFVTDLKNLSISVDPEVETLWETSFDSGEDDYVQDVAVDAWGNMYIAGYLNDGTQKDSLTVKLDPSGNFLWAKEYDSGFDDTIRAMDLDADGNAYVLGTYHTGTAWMRLIIKYDPDGNVLFNLHLDGGQRITNDIAVDKADGSFYVVNTGFETYKYDADGNPLWNRSYGSQLADKVFVDDQGHVYVAGHKLVDSQSDVAVVIYDSAGNQLEAWTYDSGLNETVVGLALDPDGNVIVGGYVHNGTNHDRMLVKFDPTGNLIWSRSYDDGSYEYIRNIAADFDGNIYVASSGGLTIKYDSDGQEVWRVAETSVALFGVAIDDMLNVYVAGTGSDYKAFKYKQNLPLEIRTSALPDGNVTVAYSRSLEAAGGTLPYTWSIASGSLPDGLVLDSASGVISGIPTTPGTSGFTVQVVGARGKTAYEGLSITVHELQITTTTLSYGTVGTAYVQGLSASGGIEPYSWTIMNGVLPDGLTLDGVTGAISGTPATAGTSNFTVQVTDANSSSATKDLSIVVYDPLGITTSSFSYGVTGRAYSDSLAAIGGLEPYSWAITNSTLPDGLILNSTTGDISGTPTTAGVSVFVARVTDANTEFDEQTLSIPIYDPVTVDTIALPYGVAGRTYSNTLSASGGVPPYTWVVVSGSLPDGLALDGVAGTITGMPTTAGVFNFTVQATDDIGETGSGVLSIAVYDPVSISTTSLPNGEVGTSYNETLLASGGLAPYSWSVTAGSLPDGLSLDGAGVISGTPTMDGIFDFTVGVIDANAETASKDLSISVGKTTTYYILTASNCGAATYSRGPQYAQLGTASGDCSVGDTLRWKFKGGPNDILVGYLANGGYASDTAIAGSAIGNDLSFFINGSGGTGFIHLAEVNPSDGTVVQVLSTVSVSISPDTLTSVTNISTLSGTVSAGNTVGIVLSMTSTERAFNEITWGTTGGGPGLEQWFTVSETPLGSASPPANNPPVAAANGPYSGTVDTPVAFSSSGSGDPDGDAITYLWDFGDGNTSTEANPTYTYTSANTYTVTLTVTDTSNASDTDTTTATITVGTNQPPVADAGSDKTAQVREIITFDGSGSYDLDGTISSYSWDFGDGKTDSGVLVSHDYKKDGTYTVTLTVTDNQGATAQDTAVVTVSR